MGLQFISSTVVVRRVTVDYGLREVHWSRVKR